MFQYQIFGESHGEAIGVVLEGLPAGIALDAAFITREMERRRARKGGLSTTRIESDEPRILSGAYQGKTSGTPLCAVISNENTRSQDYAATQNLARPSHGDYTGFVRYQGCNDPRGGGHFSGRLTAPLVFAGAVAKLILRERGIAVGAHIAQIGRVKDAAFDPVGLTEKDFEPLWAASFSVLDPEAGERMKAEVQAARMDADSIGGIIECGITGMPCGIGEPGIFSLESILSRHLFGVPAVKGIEFGEGFGFAEMRGSAANDPMRMQEGRVVTETNRNGGILGGISNGMPVIFRVAVKPTASIGQEQRTVNLETMENARLTIKGRHDPCILSRASVVVESAAALGLCEALL
ncbi:MAG: chorismate synthase [Candidatus Merdivicinus sp.]|jgi:chorismate synthase